MLKTTKIDIAVIGAGAGGLSISAGAVQMGASVALIESGKMGGDCLNYGCIPSKSLLAAAKAANTMRLAAQFGLTPVEPKVNIEKVMASVQSVIADIAVNDSVERFEKLGVQVIQEKGYFQDDTTLRAGDTLIKAKRYVIATGSTPAIPPIPGLDKVPFFTNESIFTLQKTPSHLIVIGGGPIGCELAQAFLLLGIKVTLVEAFKILPRDEQDLVELLRTQLLMQGLNLLENTKTVEIKQNNNEIYVTIQNLQQTQTLIGSHLLVATGRQPNVNSLHLDAAGVQYSNKGIQVDRHLRTTNKKIYAIGDVIGGYQFTHLANYHAGIVLRNLLFRLPVKVDYRAVPWVTYTHPELAHVGLTSEEANKQNLKTTIVEWQFSENDRANTEHETLGKIKVITHKRGKIVGVSILGPHSGELIAPWVSAIKNCKSMSWMADMIVPYPTLSEINKRVAGEYYTPMLFSPRTKWLVKLLKWFW